jgi:RpiR family carbohydrate utilization transcriptional regulator
MTQNKDDLTLKPTPRTRGALARLRRDLSNFRSTERRVAQVFLDNPAAIVGLSVTEVSDLADVSDATVVRFCQRLGFSGFAEFKIQLASEIAEPFQIVHADIDAADGSLEIIEKVFKSNMQALYDTLEVLNKEAFLAAVEAICKAKGLRFFGVGTSAPIAMDAWYRFDQLGIPSLAIIDSIQMGVAAAQLDEKTTVVGISHSGATRATVEALELAAKAGAVTICITSFQRSPIVSVSKIALIVAARETSYRAEAMASRLAHLCVLDALHVAVAHRNPEFREAQLRRSAEIVARHRF